MVSNIRFVSASAGAGTGKTYSLVENYIENLLGINRDGKLRPTEILAVTFTQKAAHEMRLRIASRLLTLKAEAKNEKEKSEFLPIIRSIPTANIDTFHGFCLKLLSEFHYALPHGQNIIILSENEERNLYKNILYPILLKKLKNNQQNMGNLIQRFRLKNNQMSLGLIDSLIECYKDMRERNLTMNFYSKDLKIEEAIKNTELSFENLQKNGITTPIAKEKISFISDSFQDFKNCYNLNNEDITTNYLHQVQEDSRGNFGKTDLRKDFILQLNNLSAQILDHYSQQDEKEIIDILKEFNYRIENYKNKLNLFSYSDIIIRTKDLLQQNLTIREKVKGKYKHILVDEYQDTNNHQEELLQILLEKDTTSLFVVGDTKQSIYGFRGANPKIFPKLTKDLEQRAQNNFLRKFLTINRRSNKNILNFVNLISSHSLLNQGYTANEALTPYKEDDGLVSIWVIDEENEQAELLVCAQGIFELLSKREDLTLKDITVLTRRVRAAQKLKDLLYGHGIKAKIFGGEGFYQEQEIVDILSALKVMIDPNDKIAIAILLRSFFFTLTDSKILGLLLISASEGTLWDEIAKNDDQVFCFANLLKEVKNKLFINDLASIVDIILDSTNAIYYIGAHVNYKQKWANIKKLRLILTKSSLSPVVAILELWEHCQSHHKEPLANNSTDDDSINIMTIHQSKGLEFKVVVLTDLDSSLPTSLDPITALDGFGLCVSPKGRASEKCFNGSGFTKWERLREQKFHEEKEEMARILYVALTRGKEELYICSKKRYLEKPKNNSLFSLISQTYLKDKENFLLFCKIKQILITDNQIKNKKNIELLPDIFTYKFAQKRLFSSQLKISNSYIAEKIHDKYYTGHRYYSIDGNLAHFLLQKVGEFLVGFTNAQNNDIEALIDSAYRYHGEFLDVEVGNNTKKAVFYTLKILLPHLSLAQSVTFEMPLCSWPEKDTMVEGFCDLVIECADYVCVIDFKSSLKLIGDDKTILQLYSYCYALRERYNRPIKFAPVLIGSKKPILWQNFSSNEENAFKICFTPYGQTI